MDEGTSALDVATERRINAELKALSITRIIAAHRPDTLAAADRVIALQNGQLQQVEFKLRPVGETPAAPPTEPAEQQDSTPALTQDEDLFEAE